MKNVTMKKTKLLEILKANRTIHAAEFKLDLTAAGFTGPDVEDEEYDDDDE